ncbi:MAG: TIGR03016 family PEP-CTERM system-associated outer membrane protein [Burkholderiaceae bacterium]
MAITRIEGRCASGARTSPAKRSVAGRRAASAWPTRSAALLAMCQCLTTAATAQTWRLQPSATARMTATNNSGFANSADSGGDVIVELKPRVALTERGARHTVEGFVEADSLNYVRTTVPNELIPTARLALNANAIERWLYLDAAAGIEQVTSNPFSAASSASLPSTRLQTTQYRLSPYLDHAFTPAVSLLYRNDNLWNRRSSNLATSTAEQHSHTLVFAHRPLPFGYALEANRDEMEFVDAASSRVAFTSARGVLSYAVDPTLILGAVAGAEQNQIASSTSRDTIRGLRLRWRPSQRTDLDASVERRFFDNGWNVTWAHRSPFMATSLNLARQPASQPSSLVLSNTGGRDLRSLIDAAYTTRFPNPAERAAVVDAAIANLGASAGTAGPIAVFTDYAQLQRRAALSVAFLNPRSVLTFQVFAVESLQLQRPDAPPLPLPPVNADNAQVGGSVTFNRRLTTTLAMEAVVSGVRIEGRGASRGQSSSTKSSSLSGTQTLTPKTRLVAGARRQLSNSNVVRPVQETAAFLGIEHRF